MAENVGVSLVPNYPRNEHGEGGHCVSVRNIIVGSFLPPRVDGFIQVPLGGVHVCKSKLLYDQSPKPKRVATLEEEMCPRFLFPLAKRAKATVLPTTLRLWRLIIEKLGLAHMDTSEWHLDEIVNAW